LPLQEIYVCIVQAAPILISSIVHNLTLAMSPPACVQFERGKSFDIDEFLHEVTNSLSRIVQNPEFGF
jgi:hypothetical protein